MQTKVEFKKIREFGDIIGDTFLFIRQNFKPLLKAFIYLCGIFILAGMVLSVAQQIEMQQIIQQPAAPVFDRLGQIFSVKYFLILLLAFVNYAAIYITVLSFIDLYIKKGNLAPGVDEVWGYFKYYFLRVFGSTLVTGLFLVLCFVCCVIPGIYVFPAMSLFFPVMIFENGSLSYSFGRAFKLLKANWWATAGTLFVIWIISYAAMMVAAVPAMIMGMMSALTQGTAVLGQSAIIISTVLQYACQVFMLLPVIAIAFCYYNLLERQESAGLFDRINQFGEAPEGPSTPEEY